VATPLLVEFYRRLPQDQEGPLRKWLARSQTAINLFKRKTERYYNEGTLLRLLGNPSGEVRQATVLALGLVGSMNSNRAIALRLHDEDDGVRELAANALWSVWFRADGEDSARELRRLVAQSDPKRALTGLDTLISRAPRFAEAYNQRAILYFQARIFDRSVSDCEMVVALNPCHFGALCGMGQCLLHLGKHRAALRALRNALRIHPTLEGVEETIRALEEALGDGGR
jgi:tetratricopeptide (TPR) repeat protein